MLTRSCYELLYLFVILTAPLPLALHFHNLQLSRLGGRGVNWWAYPVNIGRNDAHSLIIMFTVTDRALSLPLATIFRIRAKVNDFSSHVVLQNDAARSVLGYESRSTSRTYERQDTPA